MTTPLTLLLRPFTTVWACKHLTRKKMSALTQEETLLCAKVTNVVAQEFTQGDVPGTALDVVIDSNRGNQFLIAVTVFSFENLVNEFTEAAFARVSELSSHINDIYVKVEPGTHSYAVVVDIAREGISQQYNEPLEIMQDTDERVAPVTSKVLNEVWEKTRDSFHTDNQASIGMCVATHLYKRFPKLFGESSTKEKRDLQYRMVRDGGKHTNVYMRGTYEPSDTYTISRTALRKINRIAYESGMIKSVTFTVDIQKNTGQHVLCVTVNVMEISDSTTGFYPRYKAPKRVSIREPPKIKDAVAKGLAAGVSARSRKKALKRAKAQADADA